VCLDPGGGLTRAVWDTVAITAYLGDTGDFDKAVVDYAERYADQNELDYRAFREAIGSGRIEAAEGV